MSISITNYKLLPIRRDKQIISSSGVSSGGGASSGGGGISATWGSIIGTLSLQTDLQGVLDNKLFTADLLSTILTIDGTGSGIDADKLDGQHGNYFAPLASPTFTGSGSWDSPTFYVDATNHRVGIGTTAPWLPLDVRMPYTKTDTTERNVLAIGSNEVLASNPFVMYLGIKGAATDAVRIATIQTSNYGLSTPGNIALQPNGGNVGIGTSPGTKLDVNLGAGTDSIRAYTTAASAYMGTDNSGAFFGSNQGTWSGGWTNTIASNPSAMLYMDNVGNMNFYTRAGSGTPVYGTQRMTILNGGNVGIGTASPDKLLTLADSGSIGSVTFSTGFAGAGWNNSYASSKHTLEVDNLIVRNLLRAYDFEVDKIDVIGGSLVISPASGTVTGMASTNLYFDTNGGVNPIQFKTGDYIKAQQWVNYDHTQIAYYFGHVTDDSNKASGYITMDTVSGAWVGMRCSQWGSSTDTARQNMLYMTSSDSNNPFIEGHTGVTTGVLSDATRKFRLGNLVGITDAALSPSGYGLYSQNVFLSGKIVATAGLIGGWTINSTYLAKDTGVEATSCGLSPVDYPFYAGATYVNRTTAPTQITKDGYIVSKFFVFKYLGVGAGNTLLSSNDTENISTSPTYVKFNTIILGNFIQGTKTIRIKFDLKISTGSDTAYGQIYKNGVALGTQQTTSSTSYVTFSEDISGWAANNTIELWIHSGTGYTVSVRYLRMYGEHVTGFVNEVGDNS